jgi:hypothetical protein
MPVFCGWGGGAALKNCLSENDLLKISFEKIGEK